MTALEQLAAAVLDGRVRVQMELTSNNLLRIPTGFEFYIDVDPDGEDDEEEPPVTAGDLSDQFVKAEKMNDSLLQMSDLFSGGVATLMGEGWTEEQARGIVVAAFAAGSRGAK